MKLLRLAVVFTLAATSGCFGYSKPASERPAPVLRKIEDAKILAMEVHMWQQIGLCPGLEGKLYANANVQWPNAKPVPRTIGSDVDSLHPSDFQVAGAFIKGDEKAHLFPDGDVRKSIEGGFDATITYKPDPTKWTFKLNFPPDYSCYSGWFDDGRGGGGGGYGGDGNPGELGKNGANGGPGGEGDPGGQGGKITAFVTIVSTPYWPKLFAVIANNTFFLTPADRDIVFGAAGGQGGSGGNGGNGGNGGDQFTESVERKKGKDTYSEIVGKGPAGNGGKGGSGGRGGRGGKGGTVDVTYDSTFPELARFIKMDVSGGAGGFGGARGGGGYGGQTNAEKNPQTGNPGEPGDTDGRDGEPGGNGSPQMRAGQVSSKFTGIKGIALFGSPQAQTMAKFPPKGATQGFGPPTATSIVVAPAAGSASAKALTPAPPPPAASSAPTPNKPLPPGPVKR